MTLSNELEELLSGYLDNQLNEDELRVVQTALQDPVVQARYDDLSRMRADLKALAAVPVRSLPSDFAQRVLAAAKAQLPVESPSVSLSQPSILSSGSHTDHRGRTYKWVAAVVGIAATIALAFWIPQFLNRKTTPSIEIAEGIPPDSPIAEVPPQDNSTKPAPTMQYVGRDDLLVQYILTVDVELSENSSIANSLMPLVQRHGIELIKGAKVEGEVKEALDKIRHTLPPAEAPLPSRVYLFRAPLESLDTVLSTMMENSDTYPVVRFGMAFELPSDPLLDKLSLNPAGDEAKLTLQTVNGSIGLAQSVANSVSSYVDADDSFAVPLVTGQDEFRASPFASIPHQGKLVGSSKRLTKSTFSLNDNDEGKLGFLLLFVRER
jgi:negative regulator of sigma E activity